MRRTNLEHLNGIQLDALFRGDNWSRLTVSGRHQACQELENRLAHERGSASREVLLRDMDGSTYGYQFGDYIYINNHVLEEGRFVSVDAQGNIIGGYEVDAPGWNVYDTVCHEDEHGAQLDRGEYQTKASYIESKSDRNLYRIQPDEALAFDAGQGRTMAAISRQIDYWHQVDPDMKLYLDDVRDDRYDTALATAKEDYGDEDIENTLRQFVHDRENGLLPANPSFSYRSLINILNDQQFRVRLHSTEGSVNYRESPGQGYIPQNCGKPILPSSVERASLPFAQSNGRLAPAVPPQSLRSGGEAESTGKRDAMEDGSQLLREASLSERIDIDSEDGSQELLGSTNEIDILEDGEDGSQWLCGNNEGEAPSASSSQELSGGMSI